MPKKDKSKDRVLQGHASNSDYGEGAEETRQVDQEEVRPFSEEIHGTSWQGCGLYHSFDRGRNSVLHRAFPGQDGFFRSDMFVVGADFCDFKTGDFDIIPEYMRSIPR